MSNFPFIFHFPSVYTRHFIFHQFAINLPCTNPIFTIYLQLVITKGYGVRRQRSKVKTLLLKRCVLIKFHVIDDHENTRD